MWGRFGPRLNGIVCESGSVDIGGTSTRWMVVGEMVVVDGGWEMVGRWWGDVGAGIDGWGGS